MLNTWHNLLHCLPDPIVYVAKWLPTSEKYYDETKLCFCYYYFGVNKLGQLADAEVHEGRQPAQLMKTLEPHRSRRKHIDGFKVS